MSSRGFFKNAVISLKNFFRSGHYFSRVRTWCAHPLYIKKKFWNCKFSKHGKKTKNGHSSPVFQLRFRGQQINMVAKTKTVINSSRSKKKFVFFFVCENKIPYFVLALALGNAKKRKKFVISCRWHIFTKIAKKIKIQAETQKKSKTSEYVFAEFFFLQIAKILSNFRPN